MQLLHMIEKNHLEARQLLTIAVRLHNYLQTQVNCGAHIMCESIEERDRLLLNLVQSKTKVQEIQDLCNSWVSVLDMLKDRTTRNSLCDQYH